MRLNRRHYPPPKLKDPEFSRPSIDAIVNLFAELSEPAEVETIKKTFSEEAERDGSVFVSTYTESGRLAGFLRAWHGPGQIPGIVYDIAVSCRFQGKDLARKMLEKVCQQPSAEGLPTRRFTGNPQRVAPALDRAIAVIRTVYAISLIFGYQKLVESGYSMFFGSHPGWPRATLVLLYWLMFVVAVLGFRFFWATGNIRRLVLHRIYELHPVQRKTLLLVHVPLLFAHAVLLYFICRIVQDICPPVAPNSSTIPGYIDLAYIRGVGFLFCILMGVNALWLWRLMDKRSDHGPEKSWLVNNLLSGIAAFITLGVCGYYQVPNEIILFVLSVIVGINSFVDLRYTEDAYILSDAYAGG